MLIIQSGNPIMKTDDRGNLKIALDDKSAPGNSPAVSSVKFFNDFSNPNKNVYSWNKALSGADAMFAKGALAMYFGYASEWTGIKARNPHLNFDIAEVPQIKGDKTKTTFAKNIRPGRHEKFFPGEKAGGFEFNFGYDFKQSFKRFFASARLGVAQKRFAGRKTTDAYYGLLNKAAVMSKAWLEPDGDEVRRIFKDMVESVSSGSLSAGDSVRLAKNRLDQELRKYAE